MNHKLIEALLTHLLANDEASPQGPDNVHRQIDKIVIIRARIAGVHYGTLSDICDGFIHLRDSRRIWSWKGAFTLSEVSQVGPSGGRVAKIVPELSIPVEDIGEILTASSLATSKLDTINEGTE